MKWCHALSYCYLISLFLLIVLCLTSTVYSTSIVCRYGSSLTLVYSLHNQYFTFSLLRRWHVGSMTRLSNPTVSLVLLGLYFILCSSSLLFIIPYTHVAHARCVPHFLLVAVVVPHMSKDFTSVLLELLYHVYHFNSYVCTSHMQIDNSHVHSIKVKGGR